MQLLALPIGLAMLLLVGALWVWATPLPPNFINSPSFQAAALPSLVALVVVHELIHALVHPRSGKSARSIIGFWPSRLLFYAHYDGELSRNRFLAILGMPMLVISLLPLALAILVQRSDALMAWVSAMNALFACGDLLGMMLIAFQVPPRAVCHNQGWRTFWRLPNGGAAKQAE
jgi:hypothetical protein